MRGKFGLITALAWVALCAPSSFAQQTDGERPQEPLRVVIDEPVVIDEMPAVRTEEPLRLVIDAMPTVRTDEVEPKPARPPPPPRWFEQWAWAMGFFSLALAAVISGWRNMNQAVEFEHHEREARTNQLLTVQNDADAEKALHEFIALYANKKKNQHTDKKLEPQERKPFKISFARLFDRLGLLSLFLSLAASIVVLGSLTFVPENQEWFGFQFGLAKSAAWEVLNTDFASGFAATWIAILFFSGLQRRRREEAKFKVEIAVREARGTLKIANREAFEKYLDVVRAIRIQNLVPPPMSGTAEGTADQDGAANQYKADVLLIQTEAVKLAIVPPLSGGEDLDRIQTEVDRLELFTPLKSWFFVSPMSLVDFVGELRNQKRLPPGDTQEWEAIANGDPDAIEKLATKLKSS